MMDIEKMLREKKKQYDAIEVPEEMEERLRNALQGQKISKKIPWNTKYIAAILALFIFMGYHFDTFAYYGKRIMGYDKIMSESLKDLNKMGKGQEIEKSYIFKNGIELTLDGIMVDDNQMLVFFRIKNVDEDSFHYHEKVKLKGLFKNYWMKSAVGVYEVDHEGEVMFIATFETPWLFERSLTFQYTMREDDYQETAELSFKLDRNKAMRHTIKQNLNQIVKVEGIEVNLEKITATPTQTLVEGKINNLVELVKEQLSGDQTRITDMDLKLLADGKEVEQQGSSMSTNMKGYTFSIMFEPLPQDLEKLEIQLQGLSVVRRPNLAINLQKNQLPQVITYDDREIRIENVRVQEGNIYITIETEEDMSVLDVDLKEDGKRLKFIRTDTIGYDKKMDGTIIHKRDIIFEGKGEDLELMIGTIIYTAEIQDMIFPIQVQ